ncbi:uncharacterized protein LOC116253913 isoform X2 [Nymphaea colorata]|uniref:uncharacterized protein LOC116253913 isoform X2 n=1 Tax=Nymphaea colorata TaxID=210225 RepID=UPI00129ED4F5|nr:uncharacterized protein LOC116253913 isoform X2 [Nymphaea colorata]
MGMHGSCGSRGWRRPSGPAGLVSWEKHQDASVYPLHAALSTAVGAAASVLALLTPVPRLACLKIGEKIRLIGEISSSMLKLLAGAYSAESMSSANASLFQVRMLGDTRAHLITTVRNIQANIGWEKPLVRCLVPKYKALTEKFFSLERPIKGMEIALSSCSSFPVSRHMGDKGIIDLLSVMAERISHSLQTIVNTAPKDSSQVHVDETRPLEISFEALEAVTPTSSSDLPPFFFIFCMKNLYESVISPLQGEEKTTKMTKSGEATKKSKGAWSLKIDAESLLMAVKCSISLGLSVLFGILFTKDNGYWGGLAVAVSIATQRESTFKMANVRAQGTVLGSVYGVLGCFLTQRFEFLRYVALIPWVIFTSFLRQSEMYGYAGGVTALIGAVVILGRRNYGSPSQFAIERITETFVGILCCIFVEFIFLPRRASTLAREKLMETLAEIADTMPSLGSNTKPCLSLAEMKDAGTRLRTNLSELKNLMEEAKAEPDFWFVSFPDASYSQIWGSLSTVVELLDFLLDAIDSLPQVSCTHALSHSEIYKAINEDLEEFKNCIDSYLVCFQEVLQIKSLKELNDEYHKRNEGVADLEAGGVQTVDGEMMDKIVESLVRHIGEALAHVEEKKEMRGQMVVSLGAMGFCMSNIMKETKKIELGIQEILQRNNPLAHVNLWEIHHMVMHVSPC